MKFNRVTTSLFLLILLQFSFIGAAFIGEKRERFNDAKTQASEMATIVQSSTGDFFIRYMAVLDTLKSLDAIDRQERDASQKILHRLNEKHSEIVNFAAVDKNGYFFASGMPMATEPPPNIKEREFFRRIESGEKKVVMQPHMGPISKEFVTGIAVPLEDAEGQFNGLIGVSIKFEKLVGHWEKLVSNSGSMLVVQDKTGQAHLVNSILETDIGEFNVDLVL